ncbi:hypothetical protein [Domibacillus aminovorans]|nr:hypothetical protein [Domibacillus aminovorans]
MLPNRVKIVGIEYKVIEKDVVEINGNLNYSCGLKSYKGKKISGRLLA